jgi:hypothetical protein
VDMPREGGVSAVPRQPPHSTTWRAFLRLLGEESVCVLDVNDHHGLGRMIGLGSRSRCR